MSAWKGITLKGDTPRVTMLDLSDLSLTGMIPSELGSLSNLEYLFLDGNELSGCVPDSLRYVSSNDFDSLGLPFCSPVATSTLVATSTPKVPSDSNQPPQFTKSNYQFNMRENRGRGWQTPKVSLNATDPNGPDEAITYSISDGNPE